MYTDFFGLARMPFNLTSDPAFLFLTQQHREALAGLTYAISDRKGLLVLSGIAGAGKTTLLGWVLQKLPAGQVRSSLIRNPTLDPGEFLEAVMLDFGIRDVPASKAKRLWVLQEFLIEARQAGKTNVLIIDEAHDLTPAVLEEVRLLGNIEAADEKLLQIVLVGQSELDEVLSRPGLWSFKQRISVRLSLRPLDANEVGAYIEHRWRVAGGKNPAPFPADAIAHVASYSKGIPRLINSVCDNALVAALAGSARAVTAEHVRMAARDLLLNEEPLSPLLVSACQPDPVSAYHPDRASAYHPDPVSAYHPDPVSAYPSELMEVPPAALPAFAYQSELIDEPPASLPVSADLPDFMEELPTPLPVSAYESESMEEPLAALPVSADLPEIIEDLPTPLSVSADLPEIIEEPPTPLPVSAIPQFKLLRGSKVVLRAPKESAFARWTEWLKLG